MISLKSFLFLTHALCVPGVYLCCEQSEMSVKAYHNTYLGQIVEKYNVMCFLSSKYCFLLTARRATYNFLLTDMGHMAF